eukprot:CAMPEP_0171487532 /NCGR_PEP_ID=MMETSP0958-20121227/1702_1 /TAXON_ID=87120 /ORGANISM="Aurantiochytrium limacinum, Strain ATCCMYA-1381" /LENGTH=1232 /DNA_ID=CAMNT_0012020541 /DNA_START=70 /DNA_END=3768 /DNA_ORIENTATION=-
MTRSSGTVQPFVVREEGEDSVTEADLPPSRPSLVRWSSSHPVRQDPLPRRFRRARVFQKFLPKSLRTSSSKINQNNIVDTGDDSNSAPNAAIPLEEDLVVHLNNAELNAGSPANLFITSRYNIITFLPKNLFEQARRVANSYFIFITALQFVPDVSPFPVYYITVAPLVFILGVVAIKEGYEDYLRHVSDAHVNNAKVTRLTSDGSGETVKSRELRVGEIIAVGRDEVCPADIVVLSVEHLPGSSSAGSPVCWVDTANLDGETRLKVRRAVDLRPFLNDLQRGEQPTQKDLTAVKTVITADAPNPYLEVFSGRMDAEDPHDSSAVALQRENMILRGATLRNTKQAWGVIVGAGKTTKLRMNQQLPQFKFSHLERKMNVTILLIIVVQTILCIVMASLEVSKMPLFRDQYGWDIASSTNGKEWIFSFMTWFILMSYLVPMALYVILEIGGKLVGGLYIYWDKAMYSRDGLNRPAIANTTSLVEELGSVEYVLSDKTGTLTDNEMRFSHCSTNKGIYEIDNSGALRSRNGSQKRVLPASASRASQDTDLVTLVKIMAACNTVEVELEEDIGGATEDSNRRSKGPELTYSGESPDEVALALTARDLGFVLKNRSPGSLQLEAEGVLRQYRILALLPFNSSRKRMGIILQEESISSGKPVSQKALIWYKGADNVMNELFGERFDLRSLNKQVHDLSKLGLRTLVMGSSEIDVTSELFLQFESEYQEAQVSMTSRDEQIGTAFELLEGMLRPVGCTGVEDKLSEGVEDALQSLIKAGIQVAVLTGDKTETAMSICTTCGLFRPGSTFHIITDSLESTIRVDLENALLSGHPSGVSDDDQNTANDLSTLESQTSKRSTGLDALVLSGECLRICLRDPELSKLLALVMDKCYTTVCTRMTPHQKASVTKLVRANFNKITLSIGDGANDVSMIREADVGVGIFGKEGSQAVNASDFAIHKFADLKRLLFVHGAGARLRIVNAARASLGVNIAFNLPQIAYGFVSAYSGQTIEVNYVLTFFNAVMTSPFLMAIAMFDRKLPVDALVSHPEFYDPYNVDFGLREFFVETCQAVWMAAWSMVAGFAFGMTWNRNGIAADLWSEGTAVTFVIVMSIMVSLMLRFHAFTWCHVVLSFIGFAIFILAIFGLAHVYINASFSPAQTDNGYILFYIGPTWFFWLTSFLAIFASVLPQLVLKNYTQLFMPDSMQIYAEACKYNKKDASTHPDVSTHPDALARSGSEANV